MLWIARLAIVCWALESTWCEAVQSEVCIPYGEAHAGVQVLNGAACVLDRRPFQTHNTVWVVVVALRHCSINRSCIQWKYPPQITKYVLET